MLIADLRVEGFDATSWQNLVALFDLRRPADEAVHDAHADGPSGLLLVVTDAGGAPRATFSTGREAPAVDALGPLADLEALATRHGASRVLVAEESSLEAMVAEGRALVPVDADYPTQCLEALGVLRTWERAGRVRMWPRFGWLSAWTTANAGRALDVALPVGTAALFCVWEGERVWTAAAARRGAAGIDRLVGPEHLLEWAGPLSGDPRRDHRLLGRGVAQALAPVHLGVFGPRALLARLLRRPDPGTWASAVATRDIVVRPMPSYAAALVTADTVRAAAVWAGRRAGELDLDLLLAPLGRTWQALFREPADGERLDPLTTLWKRRQRPPNDDPGSD